MCAKSSAQYFSEYQRLSKALKLFLLFLAYKVSFGEEFNGIKASEGQENMQNFS